MKDKSKKRSARGAAVARRRSRRLAWAAGIALLLGGGVTYLAWTYGWAGAVATGELAPAFVLEDADGHTVNLADDLGRKPVLLVFYMTYG